MNTQAIESGYYVEMTDTFGGEPNYCWIRRAVVQANSTREALKLARREFGYLAKHGRITSDYGDEIHWKPYGQHRVIMVRWSDNPHEMSFA